MSQTTFGFEIEYKDAKQEVLAKKLSKYIPKHKLQVTEDSNDSNGLTWDLKDEPSTSEYDDDFGLCGGEVASPALKASPKTFETIYKVLRDLRYSQAKYCGNTGLHVHLNIDSCDKLTLYSLWYFLYNETDALFPRRFTTHWCKPYITPKKLKNLVGHNSIKPKEEMACLLLKSYHQWKNDSAKCSDLKFYSRKIEVRGAPRMIDFLEIRLGNAYPESKVNVAWIKICIQLVEYSKSHSIIHLIEHPIRNLKQLNKISPSNIQLTTQEMSALRKKIKENK